MASVTSSLPGGGNIRFTSDLINDGEFPDDDGRFVEDTELPDLVGDIIVVGGLGDKHEILNIDSYSNVWDRTHSLEKVCSVTTENENGDEIKGLVSINDGTRIQVQFNSLVKGRIILN